MEVLGSVPSSTELRKWAKKCGMFLHPDAKFMTIIPGMGYGVVATAPIKKGVTIVSCPHAAYISPTDTAVADAPSAAVIDKHRPAIRDWSRTVLRLLAEVARGKTSPWRPWLQCCPRMDFSLLAPAPKQYDLLVESCWNDVGQAVRDIGVRQRWSEVEAFVKAHTELFPEPFNTEEAFAQCAIQVTSRNFHIEARQREGPFLVPAVDNINHSCDLHNVEFKLHGGGGRKGITFDVIVTRDIRSGEQIFYNYGELSNARFLVEFGFTVPSNPNKALRFSQECLVQLCSAALGLPAPELRERMKFLDRIGFVFQEGIYAVGGEDSSGVEDEKSPLSLLRSAVFLLSRSEEQFNNVKGSVARWWRCDAKDGAAPLRAVLEMRRSLLQAALPEIRSAFDGSCFQVQLIGILETELALLEAAVAANK